MLTPFNCQNCTSANPENHPACVIFQTDHPDVAHQKQPQVKRDGAIARKLDRSSQITKSYPARRQRSTRGLLGAPAQSSTTSAPEPKRPRQGAAPPTLCSYQPLGAESPPLIDLRGAARRTPRSQQIDVNSDLFNNIFKDYGNVRDCFALEYFALSKALKRAVVPAPAGQPQVVVLCSTSVEEFTHLEDHGGPQPSPRTRGQCPPTDAPPAHTVAPPAQAVAPPARAPVDCAVVALPLTVEKKFRLDAASGRGTVGQLTTALKGAGIKTALWSGKGPLQLGLLNLVDLLDHRVPW